MLLSIILATVGCDRRSDIDVKMDIAESLMNTKPDSALAVLEGIPTSDVKGKEASPRYALLKSMALDKNYIDTTTFDVLQPAIDYYIGHGTPDEQRKTYYYEGRIYQNRHDDDQAMKSFLNAVEVRGELRDTLLYANLLVAQGVLYYKQYKTEEFVGNNLEAAELYKAIGRKDYEIGSYANALDGEVILQNKQRADSLMSVIEQFAAQNPDYIGGYYITAVLSHTVRFGSKEDTRELLSKIGSTEHLDNNNIMNFVNGYIKIGDCDKAMEYMDRAKIGAGIMDSLKYYAVKAIALDSCKRYKEALENYKTYNFLLEKYHSDLFDHNLILAENEHKIELSALQTLRKRDRIIYLSLSAVFLLLLVSAYIYYRYRLNRSHRIIAEYEVDAQRTEIAALLDEQARLNELLGERGEHPTQIHDIIKSRLELLNSLLASEISGDDKYALPYKKWIECIKRDKIKFINSTREAFSASYPAFIGYLQAHDLTEDEINYICLYALGLRGKDVGEYIQLRRHYNISSGIRQKLGIDEHNTNLGIYIRRLMQEL